jgi:hypothetical protein
VILLGFVEDAAAALSQAASAVPLEMVMGAVNEFDNVAQLIALIGGDIGNQLIQETMATKSEVETVIGVVHQLRERLSTAGTQIQSGGV